jgi:hypothetical protein
MCGDKHVRFLNVTVGQAGKVDHSMIRQSFTRGLTGAYFTKRNESQYGKYYHILQKSTIENIVFYVSGCKTSCFLENHQ